MKITTGATRISMMEHICLTFLNLTCIKKCQKIKILCSTQASPHICFPSPPNRLVPVYHRVLLGSSSSLCYVKPCRPAGFKRNPPPLTPLHCTVPCARVKSVVLSSERKQLLFQPRCRPLYCRAVFTWTRQGEGVKYHNVKFITAFEVSMGQLSSQASWL